MRTFLVVQWLRLHLPVEGVAGSIPGWEAKIPHALRPQDTKNTKYQIPRNIKQKQDCNKFHKDF